MDLVNVAHVAGRAFTSTLSREEQRSAGQYMTPPDIARFMARRLVAGVRHWHVRVLEPAAGAGILAAAVIEALLDSPGDDKPQRIDLLLYELDPRLLPSLTALCERMAEACRDAGVRFDWKIEQGDFLMSDLAIAGQPVEGLLTISNPPFLKLNKARDPRARAHAYAVHGQPNIYALFMAAAARLTSVGGKWCFITPRSWMAGSYFRAARNTILRHLAIDSIHCFESRTEGFEEDAVLQETVIAWASGRSPVVQGTRIMLTRSQGVRDLDRAAVLALPVERVVGADEEAMLSLPHGGDEGLGRWSATLATYGMEVSTGPVVAFRAAEVIRERPEPGTVPLLWLQHVRQQQVAWPIAKKQEHIQATAACAWMLVPNAPMVLLRRFSPKEDVRRVTCAAYVGQLPGEVIGLENHLNFIYRPRGRLTEAEARGLAAFLASRIVDEHFRALAGSTQVNATELRKLPLPPLELIEEIGRRCPVAPGLAEIDALVDQILGLETVQRAAA